VVTTSQQQKLSVTLKHLPSFLSFQKSFEVKRKSAIAPPIAFEIQRGSHLENFIPAGHGQKVG
jgi:hypothetical protein